MKAGVKNAIIFGAVVAAIVIFIAVLTPSGSGAGGNPYQRERTNIP
ncbi:MAG: hypothetical protein FWH12_08460 [Treponema sp.]|nr:hypothetical protein [Treponema sp.]